MTPDLEEAMFISQHGEELNRVLNSPSLSAGLIRLSIQRLNYIKNLSDGEIENNSRTILADLRGRLKYEEELLNLPIVPDKLPDADLQPEYPNQVEEYAAEQLRTKQQKNNL